MYTFQTQKQQGTQYELEVAAYLSKNWHCKKSGIDDERRGIDYFLTHRLIPYCHRSIEIKSDSKTHKTGNAFVEVISQDVVNAPGWAYSCNADYLFYYVPSWGLAFVTRPMELMKKLRDWTLTYPSRVVRNRTYSAHGLLVPISEYEKICSQVIKIKRRCD